MQTFANVLIIVRTKCVTFLLIAIVHSCINLQPCWSQQVDTPMEFIQQALDTVNKLRATHQVGPLELNLTLCADSETWAKKIGGQCDKTGVAKAYYSRAAGVGENVWVSDKLPDVEGSIPIMTWYDQVKTYNWSDNMFKQTTAQFSTLVWKSTTQFGIAKYITPVKKFIMVAARFSPPGNVAYYSSFKENVFPPLDNTTTTTTPAPTTTAATETTAAPTTTAEATTLSPTTTAAPTTPAPAAATTAATETTPVPTTAAATTTPAPAAATTAATETTPAPTATTPLPSTTAANTTTPAPTTSAANTTTPAPTTSAENTTTPAPTTSAANTSTPAPTTSAATTTTVKPNATTPVETAKPVIIEAPTEKPVPLPPAAPSVPIPLPETTSPEKAKDWKDGYIVFIPDEINYSVNG